MYSVFFYQEEEEEEYITKWHVLSLGLFYKCLNFFTQDVVFLENNFDEKPCRFVCMYDFEEEKK